MLVIFFLVLLARHIFKYKEATFLINKKHADLSVTRNKLVVC